MPFALMKPKSGCADLLSKRLLLDSRVVDVPMSYNPTLVTLSSLKPFFFNGLKDELQFSAHVGAKDPGIQYERYPNAVSGLVQTGYWHMCQYLAPPPGSLLHQHYPLLAGQTSACNTARNCTTWAGDSTA